MPAEMTPEEAADDPRGLVGAGPDVPVRVFMVEDGQEISYTLNLADIPVPDRDAVYGQVAAALRRAQLQDQAVEDIEEAWQRFRQCWLAAYGHDDPPVSTGDG